MGMIFRFAVRDLTKNRAGTFLSLVSVLLSGAMVSMVVVFFASLFSLARQTALAEKGNWHAIVHNLDFEEASELSQSADAEAWCYETAGYTHIYREIPVYAYPPELLALFPFEVEGALPQNDGEIMIKYYDAGDFVHLYDEIGDKVTLALTLPGGKPTEKEYTICGIYRTAAPVGGLITLGGQGGQSAPCHVVLRLKKPKNIGYILAEYGGTEPVGGGRSAYVTLNREYLVAAGAIEDETKTTQFLNGVVLFVAAISALLVYNAFDIALAQREKAFGILTTLGADKWQKRRIVLYEAALIGAVGIPLGIAGGVGVNALILRSLGTFLPTFAAGGEPRLTVPPGALAISAFVSFAFVMLSAYGPARKAEQISPIESVRSIHISYKESKIRAFFTRRFGVVGMLAGKNYESNRKKYQAISVTLAVCVVVFVSAGILSGYLVQSANEESRFDIGIYLNGYVYEKFEQIQPQIERVAGVVRAECVSMSHFPVDSEVPARLLSGTYRLAQQNEQDTYLLPWQVVFMDDQSFERFSGLSAEDLRGEDGTISAVFCNRFRSGENYYRVFDAFVGELHYDDDKGGKKTLKIAAMVPDYPYALFFAKYPAALFPFSVAEALGYSVDEMDMVVAIQSSEPERAAEEIRQIMKGNNLYNNVIATAAVKAEQVRTIRGIELLIHLFVLVLTLVCLLSAVSTLSVNMRLRRREFAVLKSVGMRDAAIRRMVLIECFYYGLYALLYGLLGAFAIDYGIYSCLIINLVDDIVFQMPWGHMAIAFAGTFAVVAATMLYAVLKLRKIGIIDAVKREIY